jgi:gluconate 2-dehydrogenase gamma chain
VPGQGYQLPYTPAELFRTAIRAINQKNPEFPALAPAQQDAFLASLQKGTEDLGGVPANTFFDSLLAITIEGFFSDPAYGGNRDMVAWKMIGFPGAYADYYELVDKHGIAYTAAPTSLEGGAARPLHVHLAKKGK